MWKFAFVFIFVVKNIVLKMSLIPMDDDGDSWLSEYGAIERLIDTISSSIESRNSQNSAAGKFLSFLSRYDSLI